MIEDLGEKVYRLTYPVPLDGAPAINLYLLRLGSPVLIDTGAGDEETYRLLSRDLEALGLAVRDLGSILVTHHHLDHVGQAGRLARESGAKLYVHRDEWTRLTATDEAREEHRKEFEDIVAFWGVPRVLIQQLRDQVAGALRLAGERLEPHELTTYPERFALDGVELEAIHCPGHTEGLVCLWWPERGILFANDHVLEDITPNPTIYIPRYRGRRCGLADYLRSLDHVLPLPARCVLPGHGKPYVDLAGRVQAIREAALERRGRVLAALEGGAATVLEITRQVWSDLSPLHTFLAAREIHGHLEMLLEEGEIRLIEEGEVGRFERGRCAATEVPAS